MLVNFKGFPSSDIRHGRPRVLCISIFLAVLLVVFPALARNANNQLCFPLTQWFGNINGPDVKNLPVNSDPGWRGAFRYVFGNGTPTPDVVVQGIRDASNFYISVEAHGMQSWGSSNVVVLAFDSGGGTANMQRVVIFPAVSGLPNPPVNQSQQQLKPHTVQEIDYSQDSSNWNNNSNCLPPYCEVALPNSWLYQNAYATYTCETNSQENCQSFDWTLAVKLPITTNPPNFPIANTNAITVPATGLFGFYVDVVRVTDTGGDAQQSFWPNDDPTNQNMPGCSLSALCSPNSMTPDPKYWGNSTQDPALTCKGVSIGSQTQDISTNHTIGGLPEIGVAANEDNTFFAKVYNNSVDGSGNPVTAKQVFTTFRIANYGLPAGWGLVPTVKGTWNISSITRTGGAVTLNTTTGVPFGQGDVGDNIVVSGVGKASFNGTFPITWSSSNTPTQLTYLQAGPDDSSSGGTVSYDSQGDGQNATSIVDANPTAPQDIGAAPVTFQTDSWRLTPTQSAYYQTHHVWSNGLGEQCIQVQLDSTPGSNTIILNNSAVQNMYFGTASAFKAEADIGAQNYPARRCETGQPCPTDQLFDLEVSSSVAKFGESCNQNAKQPGNPSPGQTRATGQIVTKGEPVRCSEITYVVHGCRHTGAYMTAGKGKLDLCDAVGAFGFVVQHAGDVDNWNVNLTGPGLQKIGPNRYQIHVPQNGTATVTTQFDPEYAGEDKLAVFLDLGAAIPQGSFGSTVKTGFALNAGVEYMFNPHISAEGIFGYHYFPSNAAASESVYQFSGNAKVYLNTNWPVWPFLNGGIGGYHFSSGSTYFGGNFGGGVLRQLNAHWGLQGSYDFHAVNTPSTAAKFSTVQGGIRYVF
jgi:hypothetical protein